MQGYHNNNNKYKRDHKIDDRCNLSQNGATVAQFLCKLAPYTNVHIFSYLLDAGYREIILEYRHVSYVQ